MNPTKRPRSPLTIVRGLAFGVCLTVMLASCQYSPTGGFLPSEVAAFSSFHRVNVTPEAANLGCAQYDAAHGAGACLQLVNYLNATKLAKLAPTVPKSGPPPYRRFTKCTEAVDYLFAGSPHRSWAHHQVLRETGNQDRPNMISSSGKYWGCAQLDPGHRKFLRGPWNDAYWNVLRMWEAVTSTNGAAKSQWT